MNLERRTVPGRLLDDGKRERQPASQWTVRFRDSQGTDRRLSAFPDKRASEELGRKVERLVALRIARESLPGELLRFVEGLPRKIARPLARWGVLEERQVSAARGLREHLADFEAHLLAKGGTVRHARTTAAGVVRVLLRGCGFTWWSDVRPEPVERFLQRLREVDGLGARTSNLLLGSCQHFCRWGWRTGRLSEDPLRSLAGLNDRTDRRRERRALSTDEQGRLLEATRAAPERHGMTAEARAWTYRLALETGLRASELCSLRVDSFEGLGGPAPVVRLLAAYSKRRREDVLPLREGTGRELLALFWGRMPQASALGIPKTWRSAQMLRDDLEAAQIAYTDAAGRVLDFHALRHSFVTTLVAGGVSPKVAQTLARHSSVTLTMDRYTHLRSEDERHALAALPRLSPREPATQRATGTDGLALAQRSPRISPIEGASPCTSMHSKEHGTRSEGPGKAVEGGPCWTRTNDQAIMSRLLDGSEHAPKSQLAPTGSPIPGESADTHAQALAQNLAHPAASEDPDLARLVAAWPRLPPAVRRSLAHLAEVSRRS